MITLVLLPGMDETGLLLSEFVATLGPKTKTIVVSYPTDRALNYAGLESVARSSLPENEPFILLGESFSGPIAISIASTHPAGLRGLVLSSSFARNPQRAFSALRRLIFLVPVHLLPLAALSTPAPRAPIVKDAESRTR